MKKTVTLSYLYRAECVYLWFSLTISRTFYLLLYNCFFSNFSVCFGVFLDRNSNMNNDKKDTVVAKLFR